MTKRMSYTVGYKLLRESRTIWKKYAGQNLRYLDTRITRLIHVGGGGWGGVGGWF